ncbi:uroporphyrinogen-III synthase [Roseiarcaceae bacterium H3SJ34-1]|uniref:uroporphyrinogen-III synthase n=1 Tax=Terripilifer ovatus TaxID=3032367 RepID=UPI003AB9639E|nr:uroporphyrinogen-III synthase [Roseiarcaceae bacterium H3SJ34-1]
MNVLVMRPQRDAERTARRLMDLGHRAVVAPVTRIVATQAAIPAGDFDGVIATSSHAVEMAANDPGFAHLKEKPIHVVGTRSAALARVAGFAAGLNAPDAQALATAIIRDLPRGTSLLYLTGRDRKPGLEIALPIAGIRLATAVVYEAREADSLRQAAVLALRAGTLEAALHYSRRSAAIAAGLARRAGLATEFAALRHVCISHDCALGLVDIEAGDVRIASAPTEAMLIEALG